MKRLASQRRALLVGVVIIGAATVGVAFAARNFASSQENIGVVDFTSLTPFIVGGLEDRTPNYPPDPKSLPTCQAPPGKPAPNAPPNSCRNTGSEPPRGSINTPTPEEISKRDASDQQIPDGWRTLDNGVFRFTVAIPADWYSNMQPEGGAFIVSDPSGTELLGTGTNLPGGIVIRFKAREALDADTGDLDLFPEEKVTKPNSDFGGTPGVIWEEPGVENLARVVRVAFVKDGILFEAVAEIEADFATSGSVDSAIAQAKAIFETIRPY